MKNRFNIIFFFACLVFVFGLSWFVSKEVSGGKNSPSAATFIPTATVDGLSYYAPSLYEDEKDAIEHAELLIEKSLPSDQSLEHRCAGRKITNTEKNTYCIGTNYLIFRRSNPDVPVVKETIVLQKIAALQPYQAPTLGDVLLPKDQNGIAMITFAHIGCTTPEDPLDPCGAGMPFNNYSVALDLTTGMSGPASLNSRVPYPNADGSAYILPGGRCGGAGCDETPLAIYLAKNNLEIAMTAEKGVSSDEDPIGDDFSYATWSNAHWNSLTKFSADFTDKKGTTKTMSFSMPQSVKIELP